MTYPKFIIRKSRDSQYYFNLHAINTEVILTSETYTTKQGCLQGIDAVKRHAPYDRYYERGIAVNGQYYFNLRAANNEVIGKSEMYDTVTARENGISAVKRDAPVAGIEDSTI